MQCCVTGLGQGKENWEMEERPNATIEIIVADMSIAEEQEKMKAIDSQIIDLQKCDHHRCRKLIKANMEFSGVFKLWYEIVQA